MAYRSLRQALEQGRVSLARERQELDAELERLSAVRARRGKVGEALKDVEAVLNTGQLRVLVRGASPCNARWTEMVGDERVRFCVHCSKHVYNTSLMTSDEAVALVYEMEGSVCARLHRRADGTMLTSDCRVGAVQMRRRRVVRFGIAAAVVTGLCGLHVSQPAKPVRSPFDVGPDDTSTLDPTGLETEVSGDVDFQDDDWAITDSAVPMPPSRSPGKMAQ